MPVKHADGSWLPSGCRVDTSLEDRGQSTDEGRSHLICGSHLAEHSIVPEIGRHCSLFFHHSRNQALENLAMRLTLMDESIDMLSRTHLCILAPEQRSKYQGSRRKLGTLHVSPCPCDRISMAIAFVGNINLGTYSTGF
jgi:hypothetical protein